MERYSAKQIADVLSCVRCGACCSEEELHAMVQRTLLLAGIDTVHEAGIAPRCRIDFLAGNVGIEIKKSKPNRTALLAQLTRYAGSDRVEELLVIAPRSVRLPKEIAGKRIEMLALERLWGISLP